MLEYRNKQLVAPPVRGEEAIAAELRQVRHVHTAWLFCHSIYSESVRHKQRVYMVG